MPVALLAALMAAPPVLVRVEEGACLPGDSESLGGPFFRVRGASVAELRTHPGIRWALLDARRRITLDQVDPEEPLQWHLDNDGTRVELWPRIVAGADIRAPAAWEITTGEHRVVAVLDTGIPADHPDLPADRRLPGWDFVDRDPDPSPVGTDSLAAHGTAVAGLAVGARNGSGVVGVCPGCLLLPVRVLAHDSTARDGDLVAAILWAAERADVLNASWSYDPAAYVPRAVHDAIRWASEHGRDGRGCVVVFSAGNGAAPIDAFAPEAMAETLTVGATDERDLRAPYSNHGSHLTLMAPGGVIDEFSGGTRIPRAKLVTADLQGNAGNNPTEDAQHAPGIVSNLAVTAAFRGTSAATPLVSGAAGLILSVAPDLTATQVGWVLTETAAQVGSAPYLDGRNNDYGHGRLDVGAAVTLARDGPLCAPLAETCDNGVDDDCDRLTDEHDPDCGAERPRAFELPFVNCAGGESCGDGYCAAADGSEAVRLCTADCDFDCPEDGACVGPPGDGRCLPACEDDGDCPAGTACATPGADLVPPGQDAQRVCLARCRGDDQCALAFCDGGVCSAAAKVVAPPRRGGCGAAAGSGLAVAGWWWLLRRRRRKS